MKPASRTLIFSILMTSSLMLFQACHVAYIPSMENVPLLQKKFEVQANLTPANFQAAFAPAEHVGLMLNAQSSGNKWTEDNDIDYEAKRQFIEGGAGYWKKTEDNKYFEVYGGAGYGKLHFFDDWLSQDRDYEATMVRTFLQPAIGISNDYIDVAFSARLLQLKFINPEVKNFTQDDLESLELWDLDKNPYYFIEPAITFRAGYKYLKAHFQYLYSYKVNDTPINRYNQNFFMGISLRF